MVQDIFDPDLYATALVETSRTLPSQIIRTIAYAYRDSIAPSSSSSPIGTDTLTDSMVDIHQTDEMATRQTLYLVPPPGETSWARETRNTGGTTLLTVSSFSISLLPESLLSSSTKTGTGKSSGGGKKRTLHDDDNDDGDNNDANEMKDHCSTTTMTGLNSSILSSSSMNSSKITTVPSSLSPSKSASNSVSFHDTSLGHPLVTESEIPILLRCYGDDVSFRVGELVEVIGIYTVDPNLSMVSVGSSSSSSSASSRDEENIDTSSSQYKRQNIDQQQQHSSSSSHLFHSHITNASNEEYLQDMFENNFFIQEEVLAKNPSASVAPRMHAILGRVLPSTYPLLVPSITTTTDVAFPVASIASSSPTTITSPSPFSSTNPSVSVPFVPFALRDPCVPNLTVPLSAIPNNSKTNKGLSPRSQSNEKEFERMLLKTRSLQGTKDVLNSTSDAHLKQFISKLKPNSSSVLGGHSTNNLTVIASLRNEITNYLSSVVGDDPLVGEYLLFHLLSFIFVRDDTRLVGKLGIHISGFPDAPVPIIAKPKKKRNGNEDDDGNYAEEHQHNTRDIWAVPASKKRSSAMDTTVEDTTPDEYDPVLPLPNGASKCAQRLYEALALILPRLTLIPLRIDNLNSLRFAPAKDIDTNRLDPGILQLPSGTYVIIDETVMTTGKLESSGVNNISALQSVAKSATLPYNFGFYSSAFEVDLPLLTLSHKKSLLANDISIPLTRDARLKLQTYHEHSSPNNGTTIATLPLVSPVFLENVRTYLALVKYLPYTLTDSMASTIETELALAKSTDRSLTEEDLSRWLVLARLNALSFGERELTPERWTYTRTLEQTRVNRLRESTVVGQPHPTGNTATVPTASTILSSTTTVANNTRTIHTTDQSIVNSNGMVVRHTEEDVDLIVED